MREKIITTATHRVDVRGFLKTPVEFSCGGWVRGWVLGVGVAVAF